MISEGLKEYFMLCPLLSGKSITSDFLSEKTESYGIFAEGDEPEVKKYASGDKLSQFVFSFRARLPLSKKESENKKINRFFEELSDWLEKESEEGRLPEIGEGKTAQNLEVIKTAHIKNTNVSDCVYEMKIKLTYYQRR